MYCKQPFIRRKIKFQSVPESVCRHSENAVFFGDIESEAVLFGVHRFGVFEADIQDILPYQFSESLPYFKLKTAAISEPTAIKAGETANETIFNASLFCTLART